MRRPSLLLPLVFLAAPLPALAQDSDLDGVQDAVDAFPCQAGAAAAAFWPAEHAHGMIVFEDQWPRSGDLDFNDAVLAINAELRSVAGGDVRLVRLTIDPLALGGTFDNGLGLHLPVPRASVRSVRRSIAGGPGELLAVSETDAELTVRLGGLRDLFGGQAGTINSDALTARQRGAVMVVELELAPGVQLSAADAPFDLFIFRMERPELEIHLPQFSGTSMMDRSLFGTSDDRSTASRSYVDGRGLPFALVMPELALYAREATDISRLFPGIITFAASGGTSGADFYSNGVEASFAYADSLGQPMLGPSAITSAPADRSCIPVCAASAGNCDGAPANGCETNLLSSNENCGACGHRCDAAMVCSSGMCLPPICDPASGNCDGLGINGCETNLQTSRTSCGSCGNVCPSGTSCYSGRCTATCGDARQLTFPFAAGCANIVPTGTFAASSSWTGVGPQYAGDGSLCSTWNAGGYAPAWWRVDFGGTRFIRGVTLVPNTSPSPASVNHVIETSLDGVTYTPRINMVQTVSSQGMYSFDFGSSVSARYLRVRSVSSPSWISWYEIAAFTCP